MMNDSNRITALETHYDQISEYMEDGKRWREDTTRMLAIVINQQANYQKTCEDDRADFHDRVSVLEAAKNRQAGMAVTISAVVGTVSAGLIALVAAIIGRGH